MPRATPPSRALLPLDLQNAYRERYRAMRPGWPGNFSACNRNLIGGESWRFAIRSIDHVPAEQKHLPWLVSRLQVHAPVPIIIVSSTVPVPSVLTGTSRGWWRRLQRNPLRRGDF